MQILQICQSFNEYQPLEFRCLRLLYNVETKYEERNRPIQKKAKAYIPLNVKPLALGRCVGLTPNTSMLPLRVGDNNMVQKKALQTQCIHNETNPSHNQPKASHNHPTQDHRYRVHQRELMEYSLGWVLAMGIGVGYVDFMLFVSISFALDSRCRHSF